MGCVNHPDRKTYAKERCKSCYHALLREANAGHAAKQKEYFAKLYRENSEAKKAQTKAWRLTNKAKKAANDAAYRNENQEKLKSYFSKYKKLNKARVSANNAFRRASIKQATPAWADRQAIADVCLEAEYMQMHVDHIVPLNHPLVCGLHVWDNLQLLTPVANMRKSNKFDPEMYHAH